MTLPRPILISLVALLACVAAPVAVAWPADEPRLEIVSGEPGVGPAYVDFAHRFKVNLHAWWQRDGSRQIPLTQRWRVEVNQIGQKKGQKGISVGVERLSATPGAHPSTGYMSQEVFMIYPLSERLVEPGAALAAAAAIEFLKGQAVGTAKGEERKR